MDQRRNIRNFVLQNFLFSDDESALSDHDSMIKKGIVDSTGILELISYLEETFGITVVEDEMVPANFESIAAITAFLSRKQAARGVAAE
jgi:acyl carrier protein